MRDALVRQNTSFRTRDSAWRSGTASRTKIVGVAGQRVGLLHLVETLDQAQETFRVLRRMGRERDLHEHDDAEADAAVDKRA